MWPESVSSGSLRPGKKNTYVFDAYRILRYFDPSLRFDYVFGDTRTIPDIPKVLKSRPINGDNRNSVLLKLNQIRHFYFVPRDIPFTRKKDKVVWRGGIGKKDARIELLKQHANNPLCDIGCSKSRERNHPNYKKFLTIQEQLQFKFVLSVEGNDVATNLKWILSSNSLCFMRKPRFETWFMEGRLKADHHYVLLKDDYSDLDEKIFYYSKNTDEALRIIKNANQYVDQFRNKNIEELISILVMYKYFQLSGQLDNLEDFWPTREPVLKSH
ncbi:MAG TPA: glycosyl transferase family 90 [Opitutales bacterium]|nr:glycosyl transferase family 90 [Opitutales bacterium]